jgi:hypothetical protein
VVITSPTASRKIGRILRQRSRTERKNAPEKRIGGRKTVRTVSGSSSTVGTAGMSAIPRPATTIRIG